jgi:serine/threonine-protein kinase
VSDFEVGTVVGGRYEILSKVGSGGGGVVYAAKHLELDRQVALKVLWPSGLTEDIFRQRFRREARVMSRLKHAHAVTVYDFGEHHGKPYLVMELLEGRPLEDELRRGRLPLERGLVIGAQIADVLHAAHGVDLVHRDVKPENILVIEKDNGPHAVLVDFGLAFIEGDEHLARLTHDGGISGTPQFLSPEQALAADTITSASDIYSLGCVFYEVFTGVPAVEATSTVKLLNAHVFLPATSMRVRCPEANLPGQLDNLILSMLDKDPESRPSAIDVATILRKVLGGGRARGRGRPDDLLAERSARAVTITPDTPDSGEHTPSARATARFPTEAAAARAGTGKSSSSPVLAVAGAIDTDLVAAADVAGLRVVAFEVDGANYDAVVVDDPELVDAELVERTAVIVVLEPDQLDAAIELMKLGIDDVLHAPTPREVVRKALRAIRSRERKRKS